MTEQLDRHEIYADSDLYELHRVSDEGEMEFTFVSPTTLRDIYKKRREFYAMERIPELIGEIEVLADYLPTLPEQSDADEALRALRHLRKLLEA